MGNKVYIDNGQTELRMIVFGKDKIISKCAEIVVKLVSNQTKTVSLTDDDKIYRSWRNLIFQGDNEPGAYEFYTTVDIDEEKIMNMSGRPYCYVYKYQFTSLPS